MEKILSNLRNNAYPGRGIIVGNTFEGKIFLAYFIMGRSENSRNRIFTHKGRDIYTEPYQAEKIEDPSLIIYRALTRYENTLILSNGDQTDTILEFMTQGSNIFEAMSKRTFEPDAPNYTPRIAATIDDSGKHQISIVKRLNGKRYQDDFEYDNKPGRVHYIQTYKGSEDILESYEGDPIEDFIEGDIDEISESLWDALNYDNKISLFVRIYDPEDLSFEERVRNKNLENLELKYGLNPYQKPARVARKGGLPFTILNGKPGYINLLDALNAWQLVKDLSRATDKASAASFKHVSPTSAAVFRPLSDMEKKIYFLEDLENFNFTPLASAYAKARGTDRVSSYGDFVALSETCDKETALLIKREVSDGVIAPGYEDEALEILKNKKNGNYLIINIDPYFQPKEGEVNEVFGVKFHEKRNDSLIDKDLFKNLVTENKDLPKEALEDLILSTIALKYTQSNSVCLAENGQVIGLGAGQQSRILCTRLASNKADNFHLRMHEKVLAFKYKEGLKRADRDNCIDAYLNDWPAFDQDWDRYLQEKPQPLTEEERVDFLKKFDKVTLSSDAFFPFYDNLDRAKRSGVKYIAQPGGSIRDQDVIKRADEYGMIMAFTDLRLFKH